MALVHAISHSSAAVFSVKRSQGHVTVLYQTGLWVSDGWTPGWIQGIQCIPWHLFRFCFILLFYHFCKKYKDLSVLPLCFSFTILHPAFLHSLTAIPLTDLSNLIFSAVEVSQRLEKTYFSFVFCLRLYRKKYSEQQRQQVKLYLCAVLDIHALFCMHPSFSHIYFFSAAMQTDIFTELSKTTPPQVFFHSVKQI